MRKHRFRPRFEGLEGRFAPAVFYVAPGGTDGTTGSTTSPWQTLQYAAGRVKAGDTVVVKAGDYAGFYQTTSGTASAPITFRAEPGARITTPNPRNARDGINLEGASWITIEGFTVINQPRHGIRSVTNDHVVIRGNILDHNMYTGMITGFSDDILIENNVASRSQVDHGIYVSNSGDRPVIRGNTVWGNNGSGIHMNGDVSMGGDGIISGAVVEGNVIYDNGLAGGSSINGDGVQNSVFRNNLIYNAHSNGISLFRADGGGGSSGNQLLNNTILVAADGRWALNLQDGATGNTIRNNVLYNYSSRGSILASVDSMPGLVSDYNAVMNRMTPDDASSLLTLADWRLATKLDAHSIVATPDQLFVNPAGGDYHLKAGSPAIDKGTSTGAPATDYESQARPQGAGYDIGHDEYVSTLPPPPPPPSVPPPVGSLQFGAGTYSAGENAGKVTITVNRVGGSAGAVSVQYATANGSATAGSDYTAASGTLTWADGDTAPKTFTVALTDDTAVEGDETSNLTLAGPTGGAVLASPATAVLTVADNDVLPPPPPPPPPPTPPASANGQPFAVGSDAGRVSTVTMYNSDGTVRFTVTPFGTSYTAGVKVATGDVTGDGVPDVVVGTTDGPAKVRVVDGATGRMRSGSVFSSSSYTGLVDVAVGDVTGDGVADIAIGTNEGRPRARVYRGGDFARLVDFKPLSGTSLGRAKVSLADVTGDGRGDLLVSGLFTNGTQVAVYTGTSLRSGSTPVLAFPKFVLTGAGFEDGINLAAGDLNGDGYADLVFSSSLGGSRVLALSGRDLVKSGTRTTLVDFTPAGSGYANGIRAAADDLDGDGRADLLLASGEGSGNRVTAYNGRDLTPAGVPALAMDFTVYSGYTGGLYIG